MSNDGFYVPHYKKEEGMEISSTATPGSKLDAPCKEPELVLPEIGNKMRLVVRPWGRIEVFGGSDSKEIRDGDRVIEVVVDAIKNVKVVIE